MYRISILLGAIVLATAPVIAAEKPTALTFRDKPVNGYLGGHSSFPAAFVGAPLCEGGKAASDATSGCVSLNSDGTGTWENDVGPGARQPPAPIKWYVVADQAGTVTRVSDADADTYFVILEFTAPYYSRTVGDMIAFPARHIKSAPARVVIDSKYRNLN